MVGVISHYTQDPSPPGLGDAKIALVSVETLKTIGKVILGIIGMLLFILPDASGTITKLLRRVRELFRK